MSSKNNILSDEFKDLNNVAFKEKDNYLHAKPYPHITFKKIFNENFLNDILNEFPNLQNIGDSEKYVNQNEVKLSYNKYENFPENIKYLFDFLNSKTFLVFLQKLTGIKETLLSDPYLEGGGLHEIKRSGVLKVHTDFNRHPFFNLDRRINVLIYLNKNWESNFGGELELWDKEMKNCIKKISPLFNQMVIFSTTDFSNHGHPNPLTCPKNISRKSLALYYFSSGRPKEEIINKNMKNKTFFKSRSGFKNDAYENKEHVKNFLRNLKLYKFLKNLEKKYIRTKK
jgi:Rps23 Pro-64 3,4-dihydroxylase Tpa1-like proline 4-hydroxylase